MKNKLNKININTINKKIEYKYSNDELIEDKYEYIYIYINNELIYNDDCINKTKIYNLYINDNELNINNELKYNIENDLEIWINNITLYYKLNQIQKRDDISIFRFVKDTSYNLPRSNYIEFLFDMYYDDVFIKTLNLNTNNNFHIEFEIDDKNPDKFKFIEKNKPENIQCIENRYKLRNGDILCRITNREEENLYIFPNFKYYFKFVNSNGEVLTSINGVNINEIYCDIKNIYEYGEKTISLCCNALINEEYFITNNYIDCEHQYFNYVSKVIDNSNVKDFIQIINIFINTIDDKLIYSNIDMEIMDMIVLNKGDEKVYDSIYTIGIKITIDENQSNNDYMYDFYVDARFIDQNNKLINKYNNFNLNNAIMNFQLINDDTVIHEFIYNTSKNNNNPISENFCGLNKYEINKDTIILGFIQVGDYIFNLDEYEKHFLSVRQSLEETTRVCENSGIKHKLQNITITCVIKFNITTNNNNNNTNIKIIRLLKILKKHLNSKNIKIKTLYYDLIDKINETNNTNIIIGVINLKTLLKLLSRYLNTNSTNPNTLYKKLL